MRVLTDLLGNDQFSLGSVERIWVAVVVRDVPQSWDRVDIQGSRVCRRGNQPNQGISLFGRGPLFLRGNLAHESVVGRADLIEDRRGEDELRVCAQEDERVALVE